MDAPLYLITTGNDKKLPTLEGLRALLPIPMLFYHFYYLFYPTPFAGFGYLGVDFFFVLSGFILSRQYEAAIAMRRITFRPFALRRFSRLYPLYLCSIAMFVLVNAVVLVPQHFTTAIAFGMGPIYFWHVLLQLTMLTNIGGMVAPWNGPAWVMSVEWVMNLLFFAIAWYCRRIPGYVLWAAVACCTGYLLTVSPQSLNLTFSSAPLFNPTLARGMVGFALGVLLFRHHRGLPDFSRKFLHGLEAALLAVSITLLYFHDEAFLFSVDYVFQLLLFPALLALNLYKESWLCRFFSQPILTFLGKISYSFYLLQLPIGYVLTYSPTFLPIIRPISGIILLFILIYAACLSYLLIEKPFRRLGRRLSS